jgi:hypothetical protein
MIVVMHEPLRDRRGGMHLLALRDGHCVGDPPELHAVAGNRRCGRYDRDVNFVGLMPDEPPA